MHRQLYGQDAKASALGWLAMALWVLGHPDEALARANEALAFVRDTPQPFLLARGLASVGFVRVFRREPRGPDTELPAALAVCTEEGFTYFHAVVSAFQGANLALLGDTHEGIELMQTSLRALGTAGSRLLLTPILAHLASAHLALGHADDALAALDEGLTCIERDGERWAEAELLRAPRAALPDARSDVGAGRSVPSESPRRGARPGGEVVRVACRNGACLALAGQGRTDEARAVLSQAVGWWQADLDSADLRDARELLAKLA